MAIDFTLTRNSANYSVASRKFAKDVLSCAKLAYE